METGSCAVVTYAEGVVEISTWQIVLVLGGGFLLGCGLILLVALVIVKYKLYRCYCCCYCWKSQEKSVWLTTLMDTESMSSSSYRTPLTPRSGAITFGWSESQEANVKEQTALLLMLENGAGHMENGHKAVGGNGIETKFIDTEPSQTSGDRKREQILQEHQINSQELTGAIEKSRKHQKQVLQHKLQARTLGKRTTASDQDAALARGPRPSSGKRFAADALVGLLLDVRYRKESKALEEKLAVAAEKTRNKMSERMQIQTKLELQFHKLEVLKLASALNITQEELGAELNSVLS